MFVKILILIVSLNLVSCGKKGQGGSDDSGPPSDGFSLFENCSETSETNIQTLEVRYQPASQKLLVSAFLRDLENPSFSDFFYFNGRLADGATLKEPIGGKKDLVINCEDETCRNFSFELKSDRLGSSEVVRVQNIPVSKLSYNPLSELDMTPAIAKDPQGNEIGPSRSSEQVWRYSLEGLAGPEKASVLTSCHGGKQFFNAYFESHEVSSLGPSWYLVSGKLGDKKFSVSSLQNQDGQISFRSFGAMELDVTTTTKQLKIASPSSELVVELGASLAE